MNFESGSELLSTEGPPILEVRWSCRLSRATSAKMSVIPSKQSSHLHCWVEPYFDKIGLTFDKMVMTF